MRTVPCVALLLAAALPLAFPASADLLERVNVSTAGEQANGDTFGATISPDGRYVAFWSLAWNLVPGAQDHLYHVYLRDRQTGITEQINVSAAGGQPDSDSRWPALTQDGRFVVFASIASNLVPGDTNRCFDVFIRDRQAGTTELVSVSPSGAPGDSDSMGCRVSADGRYVAFESGASNLVGGDTNGRSDVFVRDRDLSVTGLVTIGDDGPPAGSDFGLGGITQDGRWVVFDGMDGLCPDDSNLFRDVLLRDREVATTELVSVSTAGDQGDGDSRCGSGNRGGSSISADGRWVAFVSQARNLVPGDATDDWRDIFLRDLQEGTTQQINVSSTGEAPNDGTAHVFGAECTVSQSGRFVAFDSWASNLVENDTNGHRDCFLRDWQNGYTERISDALSGEEANGGSHSPVVGADWRVVGFLSDATNLVSGDTNGLEDVFVLIRDGVSDVPPGYWAFAYVMACWRAGVVAGYPDQSYRPEEPVNRAQMAVYISRALAGGDELVPTGPAQATFPDVPADHWAYKYVEYCADPAQGVVQGYPDGTYKPTDLVNRGAMAVFIARALVVPSGDAGVPDGPPTPTIPDVPTDHWAYRYIEYIVAQGVSQGYPDGTYRPGEVVDRGQMAVYVTRAFHLAM